VSHKGIRALSEPRDGLRYELKWVCEPHQLAQARSWIRLHPAGFVVAYPPRRVNSLYLDTPHLSSFDENLAGVSGRQKLRLRWYGDEVRIGSPLLELKKKRNLLGDKAQVLLPCMLDLTSPWSALLGTLRACVEPAWRVRLEVATQPTLLNHYRREYYCTSDGALRITLDHACAAYDQRLSLRPNLRVPLAVADRVVIEVKAAPDQIERLQEAAAQFPAPRTRNSKYASSLLAALT
jgi:VTC domain-containing protein